ncbi:hypothetical protein G6F17_013958 [Rhizopus arrhizus]|nr:hypothetical protein G6F23_014162 [Rhizopus arrhizus]KAG0806460.1 hypothetical protein G6F19_013957 [Rhizopus arrhizus]KAG0834340.1 hypothetical protein G6F17_013958 [Rhizopus arrhizus]KAG0876443.1 hypothetical protein G6F34_013985 [Rhizopus arrhizus]KAG1173816.1 hypothetical protein G6F35_016718 [Rhizopus arrhizus]
MSSPVSTNTQREETITTNNKLVRILDVETESMDTDVNLATKFNVDISCQANRLSRTTVSKHHGSCNRF